jgi:hypothetical protein
MACRLTATGEALGFVVLPEGVVLAFCFAAGSRLIQALNHPTGV